MRQDVRLEEVAVVGLILVQSTAGRGREGGTIEGRSRTPFRLSAPSSRRELGSPLHDVAQRSPSQDAATRGAVQGRYRPDAATDNGENEKGMIRERLRNHVRQEELIVEQQRSSVWAAR